MNIDFGINKIGIGTSKSIGDATYYNQFYIRTIPTILAVVVAVEMSSIGAIIGGVIKTIGEIAKLVY